MSDNADKTTLVRTLPPHEFPSDPIALDFDWRTELNDRAKAQVRQTVYDGLRLAELAGTPTAAVVRRTNRSLSDETMTMDVYEGTSKKMRAIRITENGFGAFTLQI